MDENNKCISCGKDWNLKIPIVATYKNNNMNEKLINPDDVDYEYKRPCTWPYYLAMIIFAIVITLVVADIVWGAETVTYWIADKLV
jgi:hypothetical protein